MRSLCVVVLLCVAGCTNSVASTPAPTSCNPDDRVGTYRVTFVTQGGNCGDTDSQLISLNPSTPGPTSSTNGCVVNSERFSDGNCKLERDVTCPPTTGSGSTRTVMVTRAQTADASELSGVATITVSTPSFSCSGTYAVDFVRQ